VSRRDPCLPEELPGDVAVDGCRVRLGRAVGPFVPTLWSLQRITRHFRVRRLRPAGARGLLASPAMSTSAPPNGNGSGPPAGAVPPHSIEAEQAVLGAILQSDRTHYAYIIEEGLRAEDFYRERHRTIFESVLALFTASEPIDVLTLTEHLRSRGKLDEAGGQGEIDGLTAAAPSVGALRHYGHIVKERALLRRLLAATYEIQAGTATTASRATSSSAPSGRSSRSPTTTARRTSARSATSCTSRSASGRSCRPRARASPARRPASPISTRSPAASSRATSSSSRPARRWASPRW
jgi:hypothetical protein